MIARGKRSLIAGQAIAFATVCAHAQNAQPPFFVAGQGAACGRISVRRSVRKLEGTPRWPLEPEPDALLQRGKSSVVAGMGCIDWWWTENAETHAVCATEDDVLLMAEQ
jgi:hypothetical protein